MTLEEIRTYYSTARNFVKIGNSANTPMVIASLEAISNHIKELYKTASVLDKAKCKIQFESFDFIVEVIKSKGLGDRRVLAFFNVVESSADAPSFSEIMRGERGYGEPAPAEKSLPRKDDADEKKVEIPSSPKVDKVPEVEVKDMPCLPQEKEKISEEKKVDKPSYNPESLRDFIGQQHIVKALLKEIAIAKKEGRKHLDNILLFGNPGLGKSTLMRLIAKELGVNFELLDCSQFSGRQSLQALQNFFLRIASENKPVVIALDEIHALTPELQSSLLTLLQDRIFVSPADKNGNVKRIAIEEFTFIGATTDDDKVLDTIKNRCLYLKFQMVDYTTEELKQIYKIKIASKGITISDDALDACVPRSRGAIRYVNSIVEGLNNALYNDDGERTSTHITMRIALDYFKEKGIDLLGLTKKDHEILKVLLESPGEPIGSEVLAARVGLDVKKYLSEYEKYLIKIGFINVSGRGRVLTEKAIKYLKDSVGDGGSGAVKYESKDTKEEAKPEVDGGSPTTESDTPKDIIDDLFGD